MHIIFPQNANAKCNMYPSIFTASVMRCNAP